MDLPSLKSLVAAIRQIASNERLVVFGSGSLLGSFPSFDETLPLLRQSRDADFLMFPWDEELAWKIHRSVGADHDFDREHGYHADIVRPFATENFPPGWEARLLPLDGLPEVFCLEPHDMAVAKLIAGRPKDLTLLTELLKNSHLSAATLRERLDATPLVEAMIVKTHRRLDEVEAKAGAPGQ